ncbi:hypothetical protein OKW34_000134 [Paraburkholderia youngii]|uniref:hypothetical protein n=1 Tax=Paraburkholderia youngii TaxID=2782701 RepID=UPI003D1FF486
MRSRRLRAALTLFGLLPGLLAAVPVGTQAAMTRQLSYQTKLCAINPYVYYINGIWGSSQDVEQASADAIQQAMTAAGQVDAGHVTSIFNPTEGHVLDVFRKLLLQKAQETSSTASLLDYAENVILASNGQQNDLSGSDASAAQSALSTGAATVIQDVLSDPLAAQVLDSVMSKVVPTALQGNKVVVIAHSEGNMFAQQMYAAAKTSGPSKYNPYGIAIGNAFQVVNVATPAAKPDTGKYITSQSDIVIDKLATLLAWITQQLAPAPANVNPGISADLSGHGFLSVYLNPALSTNEALPINPTMEGEVMRLVGLAASDAAPTQSADPNASYPVSLYAGSGNNNVTYTVTFNGTPVSSTYVVASGGYLPILQLACSQLQPGTYSIVGTAAPSRGGPPYQVNFELEAWQFGVTPVGTMLFSLVNTNSTSAATQSFSVGDLVVQADPKTGGYDLSLYGYMYQ